jgi:predicted acetyltransferase
MTDTVRPLAAADLDQAWQLDLQLFREEIRHRDHYDAQSPPERFQGAFDARGRLVAMARALPLGQFFGGRRVAMGGLASVGVAPEARGRGLGLAVCRAALADVHARGEVVSSLFPATSSLYRKLGYELAGAYVIRRIGTRALRALPLPATRRIERGERSDLPRLRDCYTRFARTLTGFLDRTPARWHLYEQHFDDFGFLLSLDAAGELDGYLVYSQRPPLDVSFGYSLRVRDHVAHSRGALAALFWTLGSSSTQAADVVYQSSPEDPLLLLLDQQEELVQGDIRWMTRLVDARGAIAQRGFVPGVSVEVPLVLDEPRGEGALPALAGNAGGLRLVVSGGEGRLEADARGSGDAPRLSAGGVASLYSGWAQTATLARAGLLEGGSPRQRADLDAAFAGPTPCCPRSSEAPAPEGQRAPGPPPRPAGGLGSLGSFGSPGSFGSFGSPGAFGSRTSLGSP